MEPIAQRTSRAPLIRKVVFSSSSQVFQDFQVLFSGFQDFQVFFQDTFSFSSAFFQICFKSKRFQLIFKFVSN